MYIPTAWVSILFVYLEGFLRPKATDEQRQGYPAFLFVFSSSCQSNGQHGVSVGENVKHKHGMQRNALNQKRKVYDAPFVEIIEIEPQGILCASGGVAATYAGGGTESMTMTDVNWP